MFRVLVLAAVACLLLTAPVEAKRIARPFGPVEKLVRADAVAVGKVTAMEKDTVDAVPEAGATDKVTYRVAVIKVESGVFGAENLTHVKVGFVPPAPGTVPGGRGRGFAPVVLTEGMEGLFYLTKHHSGAFYTISPMLAPATTGDANYKDELALAKTTAAVLADPTKALKADKPADRFFAATVVLTRYRTAPEGASEVVTAKVPVEESRLVLKALAEGDWNPDPKNPNALSAYTAFVMLGLTERDGWKPQAVKPGENHLDKMREAFGTWLAGPGKDYQINKLVAKQK